jgi:hypothetical protein
MGAVWTVQASSQVDSVAIQTFTQKTELGLGVSLYYPKTYSAWNPALSLVWDKETLYAKPAYRTELGSGSLFSLVASPALNASVDYFSAISSRQSIWPEEGFNLRLGNQWRLGGFLGSSSHYQENTTQALWIEQHYYHLGNHVVLSPQWQASWSNHNSIRLIGRSRTVVEPFSTPSFDQLVIRGYPSEEMTAKQAVVGSIDLRVPMRRVEKGWATYPIFLRTIQGLGFIEDSFFRGSLTATQQLPSWGAGLLADLTVFYSVPVSVSVQFHQGANRGQGGEGEGFLEVGLGQLSF